MSGVNFTLCIIVIPWYMWCGPVKHNWK